ncbi:DUF6415 family natural product biosynthesis protein [Streptomyces venezuelae]
MTAGAAEQNETTWPESLPVRVKNPRGPAAEWSPPFDEPGYGDLLAAIRAWDPVDWDQVYDDLSRVLNEEISHHAAGPRGRGRRGPAAPGHDEAAELARRFRGALMQLVNRGLRDNADKHPAVAELIDEALTLRTEELPGDEQQALILLRKLGRTTLELAEHLELSSTA